MDLNVHWSHCHYNKGIWTTLVSGQLVGHVESSIEIFGFGNLPYTLSRTQWASQGKRHFEFWRQKFEIINFGAKNLKFTFSGLG